MNLLKASPPSPNFTVGANALEIQTQSKYMCSQNSNTVKIQYRYIKNTEEIKVRQYQIQNKYNYSTQCKYTTHTLDTQGKYNGK